MLQMRNYTDNDLAAIRCWPAYPGDMAQMDYALRADGWLDDFRSRPDARIFIAEDDSEVIGFTILAPTGEGDAEFRIALRADRTGRGLGEGITRQTLERGFGTMGLDRIHLIVRTNNHRGIGLYCRLGFQDRGTCHREIQGQPVEFRLMVMEREQFVRQAGLS